MVHANRNLGHSASSRRETRIPLRCAGAGTGNHKLRARTSGELLPILTADEELFCVMVAGGVSQADAAVKAGYSRDYGWDLCQRPEIRDRIAQLASETPDDARRSVRAGLRILRARAAAFGTDPEVCAEIDCRLRVLEVQAKVEGMIVARKQIAKLSASLRLNRDELDAALQADLERLAPGAAGKLARLGRAPSQSDIERIAAGEDPIPDGGESETLPA